MELMKYRRIIMTSNEKIHSIIHSASAAAAAVGGSLAQLPGSDMPVLCGIQATMVMAIANEYGVDISNAAAMDLVINYAAGYGGRALSQALIGWIPGWGNAINATTAATITEGVGWGANKYFTPEAIAG
jgi:uncharacterized protein (DUF697 family)